MKTHTLYVPGAKGNISGFIQSLTDSDKLKIRRARHEADHEFPEVGVILSSGKKVVVRYKNN